MEIIESILPFIKGYAVVSIMGALFTLIASIVTFFKLLKVMKNEFK